MTSGGTPRRSQRLAAATTGAKPVPATKTISRNAKNTPAAKSVQADARKSTGKSANIAGGLSTGKGAVGKKDNAGSALVIGKPPKGCFDVVGIVSCNAGWSSSSADDFELLQMDLKPYKILDGKKRPLVLTEHKRFWLKLPKNSGADDDEATLRFGLSTSEHKMGENTVVVIRAREAHDHPWFKTSHWFGGDKDCHEYVATLDNAYTGDAELLKVLSDRTKPELNEFRDPVTGTVVKYADGNLFEGPVPGWYCDEKSGSLVTVEFGGIPDRADPGLAAAMEECFKILRELVKDKAKWVTAMKEKCCQDMHKNHNDNWCCEPGDKKTTPAEFKAGIDLYRIDIYNRTSEKPSKPTHEFTFETISDFFTDHDMRVFGSRKHGFTSVSI